MRAVIFSDAHFSIKHLAPASASLEFIRDFVNDETNGVEAVFFLGDLFDSRVNIHAKVFTTLCAILQGFNIPICAVVGNHDLYQEGGRSPVEFLPNVLAITKPIFYSESKIFLIPWCKELPKTIPFSSFIFGHFDVDSFYAGYKGKFAVSKLTSKVSHKIFLGHVHKPGQPTKKIEYVGPTFRHSFSEEEINPRAILLDTVTGDQQDIYLPTPVYKTIKYGDTLHDSYNHVRVLVPREISPQTAAEYYPNTQLVFEKKSIEDARQEVHLLPTIEDLVSYYVRENPLEGYTHEELFSYAKEVIRR